VGRRGCATISAGRNLVTIETACPQLEAPELPPNGFALRLETVENLSRWNAPILGNYLVAFRLSGRTDIPQRGILILGQICGEILLHEEVRQQFEGLCQVVAGPTFGG
jgi:hypothetical protein